MRFLYLIFLLSLSACAGVQVGGTLMVGGGTPCYLMVHPQAGIVTLGTLNHPIRGERADFIPAELEFEPKREDRLKGAELLLELDRLQKRACHLRIHAGEEEAQEILQGKRDFLLALLEAMFLDLESASNPEEFGARVRRAWEEFRGAGYGQGKM